MNKNAAYLILISLLSGCKFDANINASGQLKDPKPNKQQTEEAQPAQDNKQQRVNNKINIDLNSTYDFYSFLDKLPRNEEIDLSNTIYENFTPFTPPIESFIMYGYDLNVYKLININTNNNEDAISFKKELITTTLETIVKLAFLDRDEFEKAYDSAFNITTANENINDGITFDVDKYNFKGDPEDYHTYYTCSQKANRTIDKAKFNTKEDIVLNDFQFCVKKFNSVHFGRVNSHINFKSENYDVCTTLENIEYCTQTGGSNSSFFATAGPSYLGINYNKELKYDAFLSGIDGIKFKDYTIDKNRNIWLLDKNIGYIADTKDNKFEFIGYN